MIGDRKGQRIDGPLSDYVVFDIETTGLSPYKDGIVELSALKVIGGQVQEEFSTLVNPGRPISYAASRVNGITDDMVEDAPFIEEVLPEFLEFVGDLPLLGHNIHSFDMKFIYNSCEEYLEGYPDNDYVDSLYLARRCPLDTSGCSLTVLADYFGISTQGAHRALADCYMTYQGYERLKEISEGI